MTNVFKKYGMAIVAILMIVGFSAFKVVEKAVSDETWYFTGSTNTGTGDPSQYSDDPSHALDCGGTPNYVCEIVAPRNSSNEPDLDAIFDLEESITYGDLINEAMTNKQVNDVVKSFKQF